jgi:hypothetical protein
LDNDAPVTARRTATARFVALVATLAATAGLAACGGGSSGRKAGTAAHASTTTSGRATTSTASNGASRSSTATTPCRAAARPARYSHVVVFTFENRTWSAVGGPGFPAMPYLHSLAAHCPYFVDWTESDTSQDSATQYVSQWQGSTDHTVRNDCSPGPSCDSTAPNIARQVRDAGGTARSYVEGATKPCSADGNAAKHIPALYFSDRQDASACTTEVRPLTQLDPNHLPTFAFITPSLCNDGHDCGNDVVDRWAAAHIQPVLDSASYRAGQVLVEVWYDEDHPVSNLYLAPSGRPGPLATPGMGYAATLRAWESALGLPCLAHACSAPDLRAAAGV